MTTLAVESLFNPTRVEVPHELYAEEEIKLQLVVPGGEPILYPAKLYYNIFFEGLTVGKVELSKPRDGMAWMGYRRFRDEGKGAVTQAANCLRDTAFDTLELDSIKLLIAKKNVRSRRLAVRLGAILTHYPAEKVTDEWTITKGRLYE